LLKITNTEVVVNNNGLFFWATHDDGIHLKNAPAFRQVFILNLAILTAIYGRIVGTVIMENISQQLSLAGLAQVLISLKWKMVLL
jgi:hypothetical protein